MIIGYGSVREVDSIRYDLHLNVSPNTASFTDSTGNVYTIGITEELVSAINNGNKIWVTWQGSNGSPTYRILTESGIGPVRHAQPYGLVHL